MTEWLLLPTKDCKCATCERARELVDEDGNIVLKTPTCTCGAGSSSITHDVACEMHMNAIQLFQNTRGEAVKKCRRLVAEIELVLERRRRGE